MNIPTKKIINSKYFLSKPKPFMKFTNNPNTYMNDSKIRLPNPIRFSKLPFMIKGGTRQKLNWFLSSGIGNLCKFARVRHFAMLIMSFQSETFTLHVRFV